MGKETRKSRRNNKNKKYLEHRREKGMVRTNMDKDDNVWGTDKGQDKLHSIGMHCPRQGKG